MLGSLMIMVRQGIWKGLQDHWMPLEKQPNFDEVYKVYMIQALEALRTIEDGVLTDIREGDVGAILDGDACLGLEATRLA